MLSMIFGHFLIQNQEEFNAKNFLGAGISGKKFPMAVMVHG